FHAGIGVVERIPCEVAPTAHSSDYLQTKRDRMGHALNLSRFPKIAFSGQRPFAGDSHDAGGASTSSIRMADRLGVTAEVVNVPQARSLDAHETEDFAQRPSSTGFVYQFEARQAVALTRSPFARVQDAIRVMRAGRVVVIVD